MSTIYTQKQSSIQKKDAPTAASVLDASSQSEALQRKADMANNAAQREEAPRPNNTGLPDNLKSGIESLSGFSMDDVRVHYNSSKPATVQALAYTQGTDIHVAPGQEKHLPHEAWHVAQQMAGRVSPTTNINGMPVNDNAALEHEADVMGEKAVQCMLENKNLHKKDVTVSSIQRVFSKNYEKNNVTASMTTYIKIHCKGIAEDKIPSVVAAAIKRMESDTTTTYTQKNWTSFIDKDDTLKSLLAEPTMERNSRQADVKERDTDSDKNEMDENVQDQAMSVKDASLETVVDVTSDFDVEQRRMIIEAQSAVLKKQGSGVTKNVFFGTDWVLLVSDSEIIQEEVGRLNSLADKAPIHTSFFSIQTKLGHRCAFFEKKLKGVVEDGKEVLIELKRPDVLRTTDDYSGNATIFGQRILRALDKAKNGQQKYDKALNDVRSLISKYETEKDFCIPDFQLAYDSNDGRIYVIDPGGKFSNSNHDKELALLKKLEQVLDSKLYENGKTFRKIELDA